MDKQAIEELENELKIVASLIGVLKMSPAENNEILEAYARDELTRALSHALEIVAAGE